MLWTGGLLLAVTGAGGEEPKAPATVSEVMERLKQRSADKRWNELKSELAADSATSAATPAKEVPSKTKAASPQPVTATTDKGAATPAATSAAATAVAAGAPVPPESQAAAKQREVKTAAVDAFVAPAKDVAASTVDDPKQKALRIADEIAARRNRPLTPESLAFESPIAPASNETQVAQAGQPPLTMPLPSPEAPPPTPPRTTPSLVAPREMTPNSIDPDTIVPVDPVIIPPVDVAQPADQFAPAPPQPAPQYMPRALNEIMPYADYSPQGIALCPSPEARCPADLPLPVAGNVDRAFAPLQMQWTASNVFYNPLYFEDPALERYGHSYCPLVQPFASMGHFGVQLVGLPYFMAIDPPCKCVSPLGFYRPGDCAPKQCEPIPLNCTAAAVAAGFWTAVIVIMPF